MKTNKCAICKKAVATQRVMRNGDRGYRMYDVCDKCASETKRDVSARKSLDAVNKQTEHNFQQPRGAKETEKK